MEGKRIYFDNAATSFPKPPGVHEAMQRYGTALGASPGRGSYREAMEAARILRVCRRRLADLINHESPDHIIFTHNASDALNLAIKGLLLRRLRTKPGEPIHVVETAMEHNSVLRPLRAMEAWGVRTTRVEVDPETSIVDPARIREAIRPGETALVAVVHASNVTGAIQPVGEVGAICREARVPLLVDAAQSLGHIGVDVRAMGIDLLAFPGHKGLLGPLGTGGLAIRPGLEAEMDPLREGGTGSESEQDTQPLAMPDRFEAGSHNTIGIAGLSEGVAWLLERGIDAVRAHEVELMEAMLRGLGELAPAIRVLGPGDSRSRVGVFSVTHEALDPHTLAMTLEQTAGVLTRPGLHCAPHAHGTLDTLDAGGACRLSLGPFLTTDDVRTALDALARTCETRSRATALQGSGG